MHKIVLLFIVILFAFPAFVGAEHQSVPFCGDGIVEEGEKCTYDVGLTSQCWKAGAKIGVGNHYQIGEYCLGYDVLTKSATNESGICLRTQSCWIGGDEYKDTLSRIVVIDKASGLEEYIKIYFYDPGRSLMRGYQTDAYVKEILEGPDHYLANFCNTRAPCVHNNDKGSSQIGDRNGKWNSFAIRSQPGVIIPVTDFSDWFEAEPSDEDKAHWYQTRPKIKPHISYFGIKQPGKYQLGIIDARGNRVESEPFIVCNDAECEPTEVSGIVYDGHDFIVPDMEVILSQETKDYKGLEFTTYTDREGKYSFNEVIDKDRPIKLTLTLKGRPDAKDKDRFLIYDEQAEGGSVLNSSRQPVSVTTKEFAIEDIPTTVSIISFREDIEFFESANISDRKLLDDFARIHFHVAEAMRFAEDTLGVVMNDPEPLSVRGNNTRPVSFYRNSSHTFYLSEDDTLWDSFDKPDNNEWHEISHGIMARSNIGGTKDFPEPRHPYGEWNHLGYANPGTTDSWVEGFATFLSSVMQQELQYQLAWADKPWIYQYGEFGTLHLDTNVKVWASLGRKESFAVATLLWDFYDNRKMYGGKDDEDESLSIDVLWGVLNDEEMRDMKDVYDALSKVVPQKTVDEIFISHGFYFDENANRKYDDGEVVGTAANGGAFFTDYDFDRNGYGNYDVNTKVGRLLQGGTKRIEAPITAGDDVPRWATADTDGDLDIATLILSPDGDSYSSAVIDTDGDDDFGPLSDLDGDGKAELTEMPFWVLPFDLRRGVPDFPEEMLTFNIADESGQAVAESYVVTKYEFDEPFAYRNYTSRTLIGGSQKVSLWVPEGATLTITAEAGSHESEEQTITYVDFFNNLGPRSDQGELALTLPASSGEIAAAIETEKKEREETEPMGDTSTVTDEDDDTDNKSNGFWVVLMIFLFLLGGGGSYLYKKSRN